MYLTNKEIKGLGDMLDAVALTIEPFEIANLLGPMPGRVLRKWPVMRQEAGRKLEDGVSPQFLKAYWDTLRHAIYQVSGERVDAYQDPAVFNKTIQLVQLATEIDAVFKELKNE